MQEQDAERNDIEMTQPAATGAESAPEQPANDAKVGPLLDQTDCGDESDADVELAPADEESEVPADLLPDGLAVIDVIEAMLFSTDNPLPATRIAQVLDQGTARQVRKHIRSLNERYEQNGTTFRVHEIAGGYQLLTLPPFQPWLAKLLRARQESRLSPTQMETLAIIAYKQPVLRADIEAIRGVAAGDVVNRLRELGMVKIVGRAEDVGRPLLYGTTRKFLRVFGLGSLDDLPRVEELKPPAAVQQVSAEPLAALPPPEPNPVPTTDDEPKVAPLDDRPAEAISHETTPQEEPGA